MKLALVLEVLDCQAIAIIQSKKKIKKKKK